MHGRHALSRVWARHTASLGFDRVIVCITEGDDLLGSICDEAGFFVVQQPNQPLSGKFNAALRPAWEESTEGTRFMILPSDDFASPAWIEAARTTELDYIAPHCCGIMDLQTGNAFKLEGLGSGVLKFGAGRVISRRAIDKVGGELWPTELRRGLDTASHERLKSHGIKATVITTEGVPITDVKTDESLWPFRTWEPGSRPLSEADALHMLSVEMKAQLLSLRR